MMYRTLWRTTSPFMTDDLFGVEREWNRLFNRRFSDTSGWNFNRSLPGERARFDWAPPADVVENADEYWISFDLPGMSSDDIEVTLRDNVLSVSGERKLETGEGREHETYYCQERRYGRFERHFTLPSVVSAEEMRAEYRNGVLSVVLPKHEKAKARRIEIGTGDQARLTSGRSAS